MCIQKRFCFTLGIFSLIPKHEETIPTVKGQLCLRNQSNGGLKHVSCTSPVHSLDGCPRSILRAARHIVCRKCLRTLCAQYIKLHQKYLSWWRKYNCYAKLCDSCEPCCHFYGIARVLYSEGCNCAIKWCTFSLFLLGSHPLYSLFLLQSLSLYNCTTFISVFLYLSLYYVLLWELYMRPVTVGKKSVALGVAHAICNCKEEICRFGSCTCDL